MQTSSNLGTIPRSYKSNELYSKEVRNGKKGSKYFSYTHNLLAQTESEVKNTVGSDKPYYSIKKLMFNKYRQANLSRHIYHSKKNQIVLGNGVFQFLPPKEKKILIKFLTMCLRRRLEIKSLISRAIIKNPYYLFSCPKSFKNLVTLCLLSGRGPYFKKEHIELLSKRLNEGHNLKELAIAIPKSTRQGKQEQIDESSLNKIFTALKTLELSKLSANWRGVDLSETVYNKWLGNFLASIKEMPLQELKLDFTSTFLDEEKIKDLADALANFEDLTSLYINFNDNPDITKVGMDELARSLQNLSKLVTFTLKAKSYSHSLEDRAFVLLIESLHKLQQLKSLTLKLDHTPVKIKVFESLTLDKLHNLTELTLSFNECTALSKKAINYLLDLISTTVTLKKVNLTLSAEENIDLEDLQSLGAIRNLSVLNLTINRIFISSKFDEADAEFTIFKLIDNLNKNNIEELNINSDDTVLAGELLKSTIKSFQTGLSEISFKRLTLNNLPIKTSSSNNRKKLL